MNYQTTAAAFLLLSTTALFAESPFERELMQLTEQRDKAIAIASDPINKRYQDSLQQLLRRATQANDLEAAVQIKRAAQSVASPSLSPGIPAGRIPPTALEKKLLGEWYVSAAKNDWMILYEEGKVFYQHRNLSWQVEPNGSVTITNNDTKKAALLKFDARVQSFKGTDWQGNPMEGSRKK